MADIFDLFKKISSSGVKTLPVSFIVVGLGNPGRDYENTRHNAGFLTLDYIAERQGAKIDRVKFKALTATADICGHGVLLMKPQTYMNNSGESVGEAARFYKLAPENIIVISDDTTLDVGRLRVRRSGSAGGHNGLKSIAEHIGSDNYPRIKVGVGQKPHRDFDLAAWVLSNFSKEENACLSESFPKALSGIEKIISGDIDSAMQICNGK